MTVIQPGANLYTQGFGSRPENVEVPVLSTAIPASTLLNYPIGKRWINTSSNTEYVLTSQSSSGGTLSSTWTLLGTNTGALNTLSDNSSSAVTPVAGNIQLAGTASQITTTAGVGAITFSLIGPYTPSTYTAHGVLLGEGTSSIVATAAGTTGQVLIGSTGSDPAFGALGVNSGLTAHGVLLGENNSAIAATAAGTNGQVLLGSTGADPAFGTLTTSTGVGFTTGAASLAINVKTGGYNVNAASTGVALVAQNAYTVTQAAQTSFSLPATAAVGDMFLIASGTGNTGGWIITQGAGQEIWANTSHTTNGATGTLAGAIHCSVVLMCTNANTDFVIVGGSGLTGLTFT